MANPEHVAKLKEGVEAWNLWRKDNPDIKPDLTDANLMGADLSGANLQSANLEGADLFNTNLEGANLFNANFKDASMLDANLEGASMWRTNLSSASLSGANLKDAYMLDVNLEDAYMCRANLKGANLKGANLSGANLESVEFSPFHAGLYMGIRLGDCYGSERFRRFASHQAFIEELRYAGVRGKVLYGTWLLLADCGRTPWAWIMWSVIFVFLYAFKFYVMGPDAFEVTHLKFGFDAMVYYSTVTFTTLGFGDIAPKTIEASRWVMAEVVTGYVMLGGLISFLFSKLLPRG